MYLQVDNKIVFPPSGSNSTQQWNLLSSCGPKYTHRDLRFLPMRSLIEEAGKRQDRPTPQFGWNTKCGHIKCCVSEKSHHNQHWPAKPPTKLCCYSSSLHGQRKSIVYKCASYDVRLCVWCLLLWNTIPE